MSAASLHSGPLTHACGKPLRCRIRVAGNNVSELMKRDDVGAVAVWLDVHDARFRGGSGDHECCAVSIVRQGALPLYSDGASGPSPQRLLRASSPAPLRRQRSMPSKKNLGSPTP